MAIPIGSPRPCKGCGNTIFKSTFCSTECRLGWYDRTKTERWRKKAQVLGLAKWSERYPNPQRDKSGTCAVCAASFERKRSGKDAGMCCSRECGFEYQRRKRGERKAVRQFIERERLIYAKWARAARRRARAQALGKVCRDCSTVVAKGAQRCGPCRATAQKQVRDRMRSSEVGKAGRRAAKARRRAVERGDDAERFDPFEIFERDGWRCHLCGCRTPKKLRGTYDDKAPELDHIHPLSQGGRHARINTACSCRKCNHSKSDRPLGQLRLVA